MACGLLRHRSMDGMEYDTSNVEKCPRQAPRRDMGGMGAYMWHYQRIRESVGTDRIGGVKSPFPTP